MTFDDLINLIQEAKQLSRLTADPMFVESIKILSPLLAQSREEPLTLQQQNAVVYITRSMEQYRCLFGFPSSS